MMIVRLSGDPLVQDSRTGLCSLAGPLSIAVFVNLELVEPLIDGCVLQHLEVVLQARVEPHDVRGILEVPCRPPLLVQRSNAAMNEVAPIISRVRPVETRRKILVVATVSFPSLGSKSLQSTPQTGGLQRTSQNDRGSFSTIQHHLPLHSSHRSFWKPSGYAPCTEVLGSKQQSQ